MLSAGVSLVGWNVFPLVSRGPVCDEAQKAEPGLESRRTEALPPPHPHPRLWCPLQSGFSVSLFVSGQA